MNDDALFQNLLGVSSEEEDSRSREERMVAILSLLKQTLSNNVERIRELQKKQVELDRKENLAKESLEKIRLVSKGKSKKHVKYQNFVPLNKFYFFSFRKKHFYYGLLESIAQSRKNDRTDNSKNAFSFTVNDNYNRNAFRKDEDVIVRQLAFSDDPNRVAVASEKIKRPPIQIFTRQCELSQFYSYSRWKPEEDTKLKEAILVYGPKNWQQISYCLDGRNNSQSFHRWMKGINPKIRREKWTFEEDVRLWLAMMIYGEDRKWCRVANHIEGRTDIQCRERFCNILDPKLLDRDWSEEEDQRLTEAYSKFGSKWARIAKYLGNRTDNTCWRRWKVLSGESISTGKIGSSTGKLSTSSIESKSEECLSKISFEKKFVSKKTYKRFLQSYEEKSLK